MDAEKLAAWVRVEQMALWDQLDHEIRYAINGVWSIACGGIACRIIQAARLVGPTPEESCPWRLTAGGVYAALLELAGIPVPDVSQEERARWDDLMVNHGGTRAILTHQYARTVEALKKDREWINSETA